jgi:hypothetical protein
MIKLIVKALLVGTVILSLAPPILGQSPVDPENDTFVEGRYTPPPRLEIRPIRVMISSLYDGEQPIRLVEDMNQFGSGFLKYEISQTDTSITYVISPRLRPSLPPRSPLMKFDGPKGQWYLYFVRRDIGDTCIIRIDYTNNRDTIRFYPAVVQERLFIKLEVIRELPEDASWIQLGKKHGELRRFISQMDTTGIEILKLGEGFYRGIPHAVKVSKGDNRTDKGWLLVLKPRTEDARERVRSIVDEYIPRKTAEREMGR